MYRPYIVCHMLMSIDGKVTGEFLNKKECRAAITQYYEINRQYSKDAIALGRVTMEESFTKGFYPDLSKYRGIEIKKEDYIVNNNYDFYMIAFDRKGKLGYKSNKIIDEDEGYNNAYIIEVLTEQVSNEYLAYLRELGISYVFAGKEELNVSLALKKLKKLFNINRILLEGGSIINGAFQKEELIDELSIVLVSLVGEKEDKPLFYDGKLLDFKLKEIEKFDNFIWLNYIKR